MITTETKSNVHFTFNASQPPDINTINQDSMKNVSSMKPKTT